MYIDGHFIKKYKWLKNPKANVKKITNVKEKKKKKEQEEEVTEEEETQNKTYEK